VPSDRSHVTAHTQLELQAIQAREVVESYIHIGTKNCKGIAHNIIVVCILAKLLKLS
jgi:hypothetical protein